MEYQYPRCGICDKIFKTLISLRSHQISVHGDLKVRSKARKCGLCQKEFKTSTKYNYHLRRHKNYIRCNVCGFVTMQKVDLEKHIQGHMDEKLFCYMCNVFYEEHDKSHDHEDAEEKMKRMERSETAVNKDDIKPAPKNTIEGSVELKLSYDILAACQNLTSDQVLNIEGTTCRKYRTGFSQKQNISVSARKGKDNISLVLQAAAMGQVFQQKLTKNWVCEFSSCHIPEPSHTEAFEPQTTNSLPIVANPGSELITNSFNVQQNEVHEVTPEEYFLKMTDAKPMGESLVDLQVFSADSSIANTEGVSFQEIKVPGDGTELVLEQLVAALSEKGNEEHSTPETIPLSVALKVVNEEHVEQGQGDDARFEVAEPPNCEGGKENEEEEFAEDVMGLDRADTQAAEQIGASDELAMNGMVVGKLVSDEPTRKEPCSGSDPMNNEEEVSSDPEMDMAHQDDPPDVDYSLSRLKVEPVTESLSPRRSTRINNGRQKTVGRRKATKRKSSLDSQKLKKKKVPTATLR